MTSYIAPSYTWIFFGHTCIRLAPTTEILFAYITLVIKLVTMALKLIVTHNRVSNLLKYLTICLSISGFSNKFTFRKSMIFRYISDN